MVKAERVEDGMKRIRLEVLLKPQVEAKIIYRSGEWNVVSVVVEKVVLTKKDEGKGFLFSLKLLVFNTTRPFFILSYIARLVSSGILSWSK